MAQLVGSDHPINAKSIVTLVVFFVVNALVIYPVYVPIPAFISRPGQTILVHCRLRHPSHPSHLGKPVALGESHTLSPDQSPLADEPQPPPHTAQQPCPPSESDPTAHREQQPQPPPQSPARREGRDPSQSAETKGNRAPTQWCFPLDLRTVPVIGVLLLLASTCIPGSVVRDGIVGSEGVRPYDILTLFVSFAYISLSLDCTGLLRYLAFLVATRSSTSGSTLYTAFYVFFALTGLIVGNDPLILSATPFLAYFTSHAAIDPPTAYLFAHFQASNLVSALLVSSNPTNLVLTSAFGLSFLRYSAWMALPTVAAVVVLYPLLRWGLFRGSTWIPTTIDAPKVNPKSALKDAWGGVFGASLFVVTIVLLVGLSAGSKLEGVQGVWTVTAPAAIVMLVRDCWRDVVVRRRERDAGKQSNRQQDQNQDTEVVGKRVDGATENAPAAASSPLQVEPTRDSSSRDNTLVEANECQTADAARSDVDAKLDGEALPSHSKQPRIKPFPQDGGASSPARGSTSSIPVNEVPIPLNKERGRSSSPTIGSAPLGPASEESELASLPPLLQPLVRVFPTPMLIVTRLPLPLVPFAFSMFVLVSALQYTGWIRVFAHWWGAWIDVSGTAGAIWLIGVVSVLGCNAFGTNIGATVLLSRVLQQWQWQWQPHADGTGTGAVSDRTLYGAVFALALGSNFGAYSFVFSASLAGLLWRDILRQKGRRVALREFVKWNTGPLVLTMLVGCLVVAGEVCVMYAS